MIEEFKQFLPKRNPRNFIYLSLTIGVNLVISWGIVSGVNRFYSHDYSKGTPFSDGTCLAPIDTASLRKANKGILPVDEILRRNISVQIYVKDGRFFDRELDLKNELKRQYSNVDVNVNYPKTSGIKTEGDFIKDQKGKCWMVAYNP